MAFKQLFGLPPEDAVARKFEIGRARHGPEWGGDRPLLEIHDELLDAIAYLRMEMTGQAKEFPGGPIDEESSQELLSSFLNCLQGIRILTEATGALEGTGFGTQDRSAAGRGSGDASAENTVGD